MNIESQIIFCGKCKQVNYVIKYFLFDYRLFDRNIQGF